MAIYELYGKERNLVFVVSKMLWVTLSYVVRRGNEWKEEKKDWPKCKRMGHPTINRKKTGGNGRTRRRIGPNVIE